MDFLPLVYWALLVSSMLVALVFGYLEYQARQLRTVVESVPGGLRFTARAFTAEVRRSGDTLKVTCRDGQLKSQPLNGGEPQSRVGVLDLTLPAAGLRIQVARSEAGLAADAAPRTAGLSSIVFAASDEMGFKAQGKLGGQSSSLLLDRIPDPVADAFRHFSGGLEAWIEKVEHGLAAGIAAREEQAAKDAAEQAAALAKASLADAQAATPLSPSEQDDKARAQLAQWRQSAGFSGTVTDMRFDAMGVVLWLIDLRLDGRVILHADQRHFFGNLDGAVVTVQADHLELLVRDEYWQEGDEQMHAFRVLTGASKETLAAWKKRLAGAMERY
jgi:hypothetical protein